VWYREPHTKTFNNTAAVSRITEILMRRINIETPLVQNETPSACIISALIVGIMASAVAFVAYMVGCLL